MTITIRTSIVAVFVIVLMAVTSDSHPLVGGPAHGAEKSAVGAAQWAMGPPIVSYWAGPPMSQSLAKLLADGNWNLVWCRNVHDLDIAHNYGLRGIVASKLLNAKNLNDPKAREQLDSFVDSVRTHPALYAFHLKDEPTASTFAELAEMKAYLDKKCPATLKYINLLPNYASTKQLGTEGVPVHQVAYEAHLRQFVDVFRPQLLSYDHYHFSVKRDGDRYFLNLVQMRTPRWTPTCRSW